MPTYQFVLYGFKPAQQDAFRAAIAKHYHHKTDITFSGVGPDEERGFAASVHTDRVANIKTGGLTGLSSSQTDDFYEAVLTAARDCHCAMCPIRNEHGIAKWKGKLR